MKRLYWALFLAGICMNWACGGSSSHQNVETDGGQTLRVTLTSPESTVYTRSTIAVQVTVTGGTPDRVELLKDTTILVELPAPYQYIWDTSGTPEGSYQLSARATKRNESYTSEARTIVVDRTPPTVLSRVPTPGAVNVFVDDPITASFSKPLLAVTVNTSSVSLTAGGALVPTTPVLSADGKTVTLTRPSSFAVPANLTANLTSAITDLAGNPLAANTWSWTAPDWVVVGGAVNAFPGAQSVGASPSLSLDGTGKPVVAFWETDGTRFNVYVQQWTGNAWTAIGGAVNAFPGARDVLSAPALALDGSGKPVVAFRESDGTRSNVYVQRWTGTAWTAVGGAVNAFPSIRDVLSAAALALDSSGNPTVAFREVDGRTNLYVQRWSGSDWLPLGNAINVFAGTRDVLDGLVLSLDSSGSPAVAFRQQETTGMQHFNAYVQKWTGTTWVPFGGGPVNQFPGARDVQAGVALSLDGSGNPIVAFREIDTATPPHFNVYVRTLTSGASTPVGGAVNAFPGSRDVLSAPALALDGTGKPAVVFVESDGTHLSVYTRRWNGTSWQAVGSFVNATGRDVSTAAAPALFLDATGKPALAFLESDGMAPGPFDNVYVRRSNQ